MYASRHSQCTNSKRTVGRDKLCSFFEALNDYAFSKIIHLYQENNDLKEYVRYLERELIKKDKLAKMH